MADQLAHAKSTQYSFIIPSLRRDAEEFSQKEGVSLDQFINLAVAEKLAHLRHQEWVGKRVPVTEERRASFLALLDRMGTEPPAPGDELPKGYIPTPRAKP